MNESMKKLFLALLPLLFSLTFCNDSMVAHASAYYGQCKIIQEYNVKNRPDIKANGWNTVKKDTEVPFYDYYKDWGYISLNNDWQGWIPMSLLNCEEGVYKRIFTEKH